MKHLVSDKVHQVQHKVQDEFDKMQPRNQEDQAWTQGKIASNTPAVEQQPSFHGSGRKIITESQQDSQPTGRIPSNTAQQGPRPSRADAQSGPAPQGQGRSVQGQGWKETKSQAEDKVAKGEDKASRGLEQVKDSVKSASGSTLFLLLLFSLSDLCVEPDVVLHKYTCCHVCPHYCP